MATKKRCRPWQNASSVKNIPEDPKISLYIYFSYMYNIYIYIYTSEIITNALVYRNPQNKTTSWKIVVFSTTCSLVGFLFLFPSHLTTIPSIPSLRATYSISSLLLKFSFDKASTSFCIQACFIKALHVWNFIDVYFHKTIFKNHAFVLKIHSCHCSSLRHACNSDMRPQKTNAFFKVKLRNTCMFIQKHAF